MNRRITVKYCFLQGGYWTLAAVAMAFTTPLLEAKGFSGTEIGILSAVKYLAVLIFQTQSNYILVCITKTVNIKKRHKNTKQSFHFNYVKHLFFLFYFI